MNYNQFKYRFLLEGGNVSFGKEKSHRINLHQINRKNVVGVLEALLGKINERFNIQFKNSAPLWSEHTLINQLYLSGSSKAFFNIKDIKDIEFTSVKPTIGDIDVMIDETKASEFSKTLEYLKNKKIPLPLVQVLTGVNKNLKFTVDTIPKETPISTYESFANLIDFKKTANQFISLWKVTIGNVVINIQIDFEMVEYIEGTPSDFSQFAHSSNWEDLNAKVKGVFHKHLLRSISRVEDIPVIVSAKRKGDYEENIKPYTFSVEKGIRKSFEPIDDGKGTPVTKQDSSGNSRLLVKKLTSTNTDYDRNIPSIFEKLFKQTPSETDLKDFNSFLGLLRLIKKYFNKQEQLKIIKEFIYLLFHENLRLLSVEGSHVDQQEKSIALKEMLDFFKLRNNSEIKEIIKTSVKDYYSKFEDGTTYVEELQNLLT